MVGNDGKENVREGMKMGLTQRRKRWFHVNITKSLLREIAALGQDLGRLSARGCPDLSVSTAGEMHSSVQVRLPTSYEPDDAPICLYRQHNRQHRVALTYVNKVLGGL